MAIDVTVPAAGESITTANVARWHVSNGDPVRKGDILVTIETDKVSNELEADADGNLEILVNEGEEVDIGTLIARIQEGSTAPAAAPEQAAPVAAEPAPAESQAEKPAAATQVIAGGGESVKITVPASGESITSASVASWRKSDGDAVSEGEILVLLETDKVSNEVEAPATGRLKIIVPEAEEVPIGTVIGEIEVGATDAVSASAPAETQTPQPKPEAAIQQQAAPAHKPAPTATAAPVVTKPDFSLSPVREKSAQATESSDGRTTRKKMSMLRRKIATHLVNAQQTAAILTTFNEVDMSAVMTMRKQVQEEFIKKHGVKLGFMSFFVKAVVQALKDVPSINGSIEGNEVVQNHYYDIGVAIGTEKGLFVPVIRDADQKSFAEIESDILAYAGKANAGKITIDDMQGGVFSISNGGTYGSLLSTPILNPPQSGILGMHTIQQRPVAVNGKVEIRPMMYLALSYDHRLVDGKEAVTFLIRIKESLESPARLMLEM